MPIVIAILLCVSIILLAATASKPLGWVALGLAVLAFLLTVLGGAGVHIGR